MSALRYEAAARRKCQFQGRVWRPGQIYRGAAEPPASVFETITTVGVPDANET
jgi:hypothetical protein